ncbi:MAG TPA: sigma-E factor regulatory protein RseB domain-containing protein, partial [Frankiaceae bacterium]|nr:sigma-E factor regulatory protein RseB domain-containing protein [Frankiaceae bacterium]
MSVPAPCRAVPGHPAVSLGRVLAVLLAGLAGAYLVAPAATARELRSDPDVSSDALALLAQAARAVYEQPYSGRQQVRVSSPTGEREVVVDIRNCPGRELVLRLLPTAQQPGGTFVEPSAPEAASLLPGVDGRAMLLIDENYELRVAGRDEVVGRPATLVELRRADGRLAARFWIDDATKLPLQREVRDGTGRVVRASAFSSLELGQPGT